MANLELLFLGFTFLGLVSGAWGIVWARTSRTHGRASWGRALFAVTLLFLGAASLWAAVNRADSLVPLGLVSGSLVVVMLCELPHPAWHD